MYKPRGTVKFTGKGGRRYKNLASFNSECPKRSLRGNSCTLTNIRCLKDGGGLATVKTHPIGLVGSKPKGTWRLHFASCSVLKRHLRGRITEAPGASLGRGRRR